MREVSVHIPEVFDDLALYEMGPLAVARKIPDGFHALLNGVIESTGPDLLVLNPRLDSIGPAIITLSDVAQTRLLTASREGHPERIERHPDLTGRNSIGGQVFSSPDDATDGLGFQVGSPEQKQRNRKTRSHLESTDIDEIAQEVSELIVDQAKNGSPAFTSINNAVGLVLPDALYKTGKEPGLAAYNAAGKNFERAGLAIVLRRLPLVASHLRHNPNGPVKAEPDFNHDQFSDNDILSNLAPMTGLSAGIYWTLLRRRQFPEAPLSSVVLEVNRFDAAESLTTPRAVLNEHDPSALIFGSPHAHMQDTAFGDAPHIFDPYRFTGPDAQAKIKLLTQRSFGLGGHVCPSNHFSIPFMQAVSTNLDQAGVGIKGQTWVNPRYAVVKRPLPIAQGKLNVSA